MRFRHYFLGIFLLLLGSISALAQTTTVKGTAKDQQGKPIAGASVDLKDLETGRKYTFKTDNQGNFSSIGVTPSKFQVTLSKDGKPIYSEQWQATPQDVNVLDLDLQKISSSTKGLTPEQVKQREEIEKKNAEIQKENAKIGNLNNLIKEAQADMAAKNYDAAVQVMQQATQADQTHDQLFGILGDAYLQDKKYPEAIDAYNKAIQLGGNSTRANIKQMLGAYYNNLGQAYAKSGKTPEAIDSYNKAAAEDPTKAAQSYYNEGAVLTNTGKIDDANAAFDKAIAADPTRADAYYQKGVNLLQKATYDQKTGQTKAPPEASENLNKYLEMQPNGPYAQQAKDILASLGEKVSSTYKAGKKK